MLQGYIVCLNWIGTHQGNTYKVKERADHPGKCTFLGPNGQQCTKPHKKFLHGIKIIYCNTLHVAGPARGQARTTNLPQGGNFHVKIGESSFCGCPVKGAAPMGIVGHISKNIYEAPMK